MRDRTSLLVLAGALALAAVLRLWGIGFGLPLTSAHPDESRVNAEGVSVALGNFRPGFFNYPSLFIYALGAADAGYCAAAVVNATYPSVSSCASSWRTAWEPFFLAARVLSAAAGVVTVLLVYLLGRRLFDETTGLASAVFLAVAFLHVRDSHFGVTDVSMTMLLTLAMVLLIAAYDRAGEVSGDAGRFAAAGLVAGFAASTKYNAVLLLAPAAVAVGLLWQGEAATGRLERMMRRLGAWGFAIGIGFLLGTPYAVLEPARFWQDASSETMHLRAGHTVLLAIGWTHHLAVTLWYGLTWPLLLCALAGSVWMVVRAPRRAALLLAFPVVYYLIAGGGYTVFARYMIPVVPFLCVAAGYCASSLARVATVRRGHTALATGLVVAAVAFPSAVKAWRLDRLLSRADSRVLAADWIMEHAAPHASIYISGSHYGRPDIRRRQQGPEYAFVELADSGFQTQSGAKVELPDWIVVQESPLVAYSSVPEPVKDLLPRYRLVQTFRAVDLRAPHVYDQQDAFFVPLAGFAGVGRPGPNFFIYQR